MFSVAFSSTAGTFRGRSGEIYGGMEPEGARSLTPRNACTSLVVPCNVFAHEGHVPSYNFKGTAVFRVASERNGIFLRGRRSRYQPFPPISWIEIEIGIGGKRKVRAMGTKTPRQLELESCAACSCVELQNWSWFIPVCYFPFWFTTFLSFIFEVFILSSRCLKMSHRIMCEKIRIKINFYISS